MATDDAIEISMRCVTRIAVKRYWRSYRTAKVPFWTIELWYDISKGAWAPPVRGKGLSRHSVPGRFQNAMISLNPEQEDAVGAKGNAVITACPGSGKTRVLAARVIRALGELHSRR